MRRSLRRAVRLLEQQQLEVEMRPAPVAADVELDRQQPRARGHALDQRHKRRQLVGRERAGRGVVVRGRDDQQAAPDRVRPRARERVLRHKGPARRVAVNVARRAGRRLDERVRRRAVDDERGVERRRHLQVPVGKPQAALDDLGHVS